MPDDAGEPAAAGGDAGERDRHEPSLASDLGANTPKASKKRTQTSDVWKLVRRLRGADGSRAMNLVTKSARAVQLALRASKKRDTWLALRAITLANTCWLNMVFIPAREYMYVGA